MKYLHFSLELDRRSPSPLTLYPRIFYGLSRASRATSHSTNWGKRYGAVLIRLELTIFIEELRTVTLQQSPNGMYSMNL